MSSPNYWVPVKGAGCSGEYPSQVIARAPQFELGARGCHKGWTFARPGRVRLLVRSVAAAVGVAVILLGPRTVGGQEHEDQGRQAFDDAGCATCHGPSANGGSAPALAGTSRSYPDFLRIIREGIGEMTPMSASDLSDEQVATIYEWLVQLSSKRTSSDVRRTRGHGTRPR